MSIIYKALQKTQKNIDKKQRVEVLLSSSHLTLFKIGLLIIMSGLLLLNTIKLFQEMKQRAKIKPIHALYLPPLQLFNKAEYIEKHKLNGVFISNQEELAMINYHLYHLGDMVDGLKIVSINLNSIELTNNQTQLSLQTMG